LSTSAPPRRGPAPLWLALVVCIVASAAAALAPFTAGSVVPSAPEAFSAARARHVLERLIPEGKPHPVGSMENRAVRERIERELSALGLSAQVQERLACGRYGVCATVQNLLVEIEGETRTGAIALAAHYDSVPAGPGAADDGSGVASLLEIARALRHGPRLARSVWLWFTDGEEMDLLGARALVTDPLLIGSVDVVVNLEARGTSGPSLMFESSTPNEGLVAAFARSAARPVAGSTFYAVYRSMPNDTDLTVFREAGLAGLNLAFIGGTTRYHTPGDTVTALSERSLQHQGEQALALVRTLGREGAPASTSDAVFFDWFGLTLVHASLPRARLYASFVLLLGVGSLVAFGRRRGLAPGRYALASVAPLAVILLTVLATLPFHGVLFWIGALDQPWPATTWIIFASAVGVALSVLALVAALLVRHVDVDSALAGLVAFELLATALLLFALPEALPLFALPALGLTLALAVRIRSSSPRADYAMCLPVLVSAVSWAPVIALAVLALGVLVPGLHAVLVALLALPLLPLLFSCSRRVLGTAAKGFALLALLFGVLGLALPAADASAPARVSIAYQVDATTKTARHLLQATRVPSELAELVAFTPNDADRFPWFGGAQTAAFRAEAPWTDLPAPTLTLQGERSSAQGRDLDVVVTPGKPFAFAVTLGVPAARLRAAKIEGTPITPVVVDGLATLGMVSPGDTVRIELLLSGGDRVPLRVVELHSALPEGSSALQRARDVAATASQTGDVTAVSWDGEL
jgi:hypothetical protein